jgi:hypothetical protein
VTARQVGEYGGLAPSLLRELLVDLLHHTEEALAANIKKLSITDTDYIGH